MKIQVTSYKTNKVVASMTSWNFRKVEGKLNNSKKTREIFAIEITKFKIIYKDA